jgi:hypothetical protein
MRPDVERGARLEGTPAPGGRRRQADRSRRLIVRGLALGPVLLATLVGRPSVVWSALRQESDGPDDVGPAADEPRSLLEDGRLTVATRRGGSPSLGVAVARVLPLPDREEIADFALLADARFDRADGPAALTARFRYRPEAGGGTGYLFSVDPFAAQVRLARFDEGQQDELVSWRSSPAAGFGHETVQLALRAVGPSIAVALGDTEVIRVTDDRYPSGLVALGAVTWSGPVDASFENVRLTPAS